MTGVANDNDWNLLIQFLVTCPQIGRGDIDRPVNMSGHILPFRPHIDKGDSRSARHPSFQILSGESWQKLLYQRSKPAVNIFVSIAINVPKLLNNREVRSCFREKA